MSLVRATLNRYNEVEYDDTEFELIEFNLMSVDGIDYLHYIGDGKNVRNPKGNISTRNMFSGCYNLKELDLSNFDTSNVENMNGMFEGCENLKELDLSNFDTSKVKDMSYMFNGCSALSHLDLSNFDTSSVRSMKYMFRCCCALRSLDLSNFNTSNVRNMRHMFDGSVLRYLDLSNFDTSRVEDMSYMFNGCCALRSLDLSNFDTNRVRDMSYMFNGCALKSLDLPKFNTKRVEDMSYMFNDCDLVGVDLNSFETFNVKNFECMFSNNKNLGFLDISMFEVSEDSNVDGMISYCDNLMDFYIDEDALSVVENGKNAFKCCNHINVIETKKSNLRVLELDLLKCVSVKEAYKKQKDKYSTPDSDFINILYKVVPDSPMIGSYARKVLLPKIEKCFKEGMSVRDVRKQLYKNYSTCLADDALVSSLKCFYIVDLDTKSIIYENSESLVDSKYRDESATYQRGIKELKEDDKVEDLVRKKVWSYFNFVNGDSSVTIGEVAEMAYEHFNKRYVNEAILSILDNEYISIEW